jgi:MFS transporter, DHA2 family, multidrug resistance protein
LSAGYLSHLKLSALPIAAATAVRQSIFGGVAVAQRLGSAALLNSVRTAFVHGMDSALLVSAGVAIVGAVLAAFFLPRTNAPTATAERASRKGGEDAGVRQSTSSRAA